MKRVPIHKLGAEAQGYLVAVFTIGFIIAARKLFLDGWLSNQSPLRLLIVPVIAAAWIGGLRPGLLATLLVSIIAPIFFGDLANGAGDWGGITVFVLIGMLTSGFMESLHATRRRLQDRQRQLEHEVEERRSAEKAERVQREHLLNEVNQRKRTEAILGEREERMRMAVESANIGTWDFNLLTQEHQWSSRSKLMFGFAPDENVTNISFLDLLHPDDREHVAHGIRQALLPTGDGRYEAEYRARWADGTIRWIVAKGQAFFEGIGDDRKAVRFIGTVIDVSERKHFEQSLTEADRRKDEFLAILAHELRNPLAPISNGLALWPMIEGDKDEMEKLRALMQRQVEHIIRLVDDLMDASRITRGKVELHNQLVDVRTLVQEAVESLQPFVSSCGHQMTVAIGQEPLVINGDVARLTQVFSNILNNAAKYTSRNGLIWVSVCKNDDQALISVRDNGPGIPEHMLGPVFEMFRQVEDTISRSHGGLGIGLTLVKQLVELHGGTVEARSAGPGAGSEFVVAIPLAKLQQSKHSLGDPHCKLRQLKSLSRHRILVVDDVVASAETLAMMLRAIGQDASAVNSGEAAIAWVLAHKPEAVFLDIAMPGMDGYEVAREIRRHADSERTVLIALTGYGQDEDRRRAIEAGFDQHLVKPVRLDDLEMSLLSIPPAETQFQKAPPKRATTSVPAPQ